MKRLIFVLLLLISTQVFAGQEPVSNNSPLPRDSTSTYSIIYDTPFLKYCDSIYAINMQINEEPKPWLSYYDFDADSIPSYLDTTYRERIAYMDIQSPFSFRYNEDVRKMIYFYAERRPGMISRALATKELYFPLFEEMLDKYQLPMELKYLAIVESALNPRARSRAGAVGLWQFMPATGRLYGLHSNSRIDDRMNPYKATEAACQHFVDLYERYQDWNLVLAAYNAGSGNVNKAIRRAGGPTDYWSIRQYLPRETRAYVPAFIAVNYFMKYAYAHNIEPRKQIQFSYYQTDTVYIQKEISFTQIADWLDLDVNEIKMLNPQYQRNNIPASSTQPLVLTLPLDKIGAFILNENLIISGLSKEEFSKQWVNTDHPLE
ncbi:MAG: lytic transglycosylase [Bacteroidetes bacterium]|nr:MAG: lytic transglycosylase [Bacteroidota bacterium]